MDGNEVIKVLNNWEQIESPFFHNMPTKAH